MITITFNLKIKLLVQVSAFNYFPYHKIPHFRVRTLLETPHIKNILKYYSGYKFFTTQMVTLILLHK